MSLATMPNVLPQIRTTQRHILSLPQCCPVSGNPQAGSAIEISYRPSQFHLEVYSLQSFIQSFIGGSKCPYSGAVLIRNQEEMIQSIAQSCADVIKVEVAVLAHLILDAGRMEIECIAYPGANTND